MLDRIRARVSPRQSAKTDADGARWVTVVGFAAGLCLATAALVWLGYVATREWRRGTDLLVQRSAAEALALVSAALNVDMKGAWATLLVPITSATIGEEPPYNLLHPTARAFARFPYAESLVVWKASRQPDGRVFALSRADRRPPWDDDAASDDPFPVVLHQNPTPLKSIVAAIRQQASPDSPFMSLEFEMDEEPYQVVVHLLFESTPPYPLLGFAALTINMQWVRNEYFHPLLAQVAKIGGNEGALSFSVLDDQGRLVTATGPATTGTLGADRRFPLLFVDSALVSRPFPGRPAREWSVRVTPSADHTVVAASQGARRTFVMMTIAAALSLLALLLTVRADRASVALASMKSDFVSAVTHELKTPLALVRLVGDTLAQGRYTSTDTVQDYARLLSQEAGRLSRSIDGLLTYARYGDARAWAPADRTVAEVHELLEDALEPFRPRLATLGFELTVDVAPGLPRLRVDRSAIVLVFENLIDNAIKYSLHRKLLVISARPDGSHFVHVTFADRGIGIPDTDIRYVFEKFFRSHNVTESGSGLGLSIARRIVLFHAGHIDIQSTERVGTTVTVILPASRS